MTIKQLIELLERHDKNCLVILRGSSDYGFDDGYINVYSPEGKFITFYDTQDIKTNTRSQK